MSSSSDRTTRRTRDCPSRSAGIRGQSESSEQENAHEKPHVAESRRRNSLALAFALLVLFSGGGSAAPKTDRETKIKPLVGTYTAAQVEKSCDRVGRHFRPRILMEGVMAARARPGAATRQVTAPTILFHAPLMVDASVRLDLKHGWKDDPKGKAVDKPIDLASLKKAIQELTANQSAPGTVKFETGKRRRNVRHHPTAGAETECPGVVTVSTRTFSAVRPVPTRRQRRSRACPPAFGHRA